jgi:hypothetical protein
MTMTNTNVVLYPYNILNEQVTRISKIIYFNN